MEEDLKPKSSPVPPQPLVVAKSPAEAARWARQDADNQKTIEDNDPSAILKKRKFNHRVKPPSLRPIYKLGECIIATPGNLVSIASAVKTGKSAFVGGMAASAITTNDEADTLGVKSSNPDGRIVFWFDSEQSPDDFWHCVHRAIERAGLREPPQWLHAYCLTGLQYAAAWECVQEGFAQASDAHVGIHSVLLDGIADFVKDPNDAGECNAFIAELHNLAIAHDCPIVGVIHFNPGSDKTRGHLGSQFERKAETNLRLDKEDEVTEIWSEKQRRAPIPKGTGPCFCWDDDKMMHVSVANPSEARAEAKAESKLVAMRQEAEVVFAQGKGSFRHTDLVSKIEVSQGMSKVGAKKKLARWVVSQVVTIQPSGLYTLTI